MDPIFNNNGLWYYWDCTWDFEEGPFGTRKQAEEDLKRYCYYLDTGEVLQPAHMCEDQI